MNPVFFISHGGVATLPRWFGPSINLVEVREHDSLAYAPANPDPQNWWRERGSNPHAEDVSQAYFPQISPFE